MRKLALIFILSLSTQIVIIGQNAYTQIEISQGFSSFIPNHGTFLPKYAYQYGVTTGMDISKYLDASVGIVYQNAGAAQYIWEANSPDGASPDVRQTFVSTFLKIPVDINLKFGKRNTFSIGLGAYYSFNLTASYGTESPIGTLFPMINPEELGQNDYGLRFKPSILLPLNEIFLVQLGILQEFGLNVFWSDVVHYSTCAFAALRFKY